MQTAWLVINRDETRGGVHPPNCYVTAQTVRPLSRPAHVLQSRGLLLLLLLLLRLRRQRFIHVKLFADQGHWQQPTPLHSLLSLNANNMASVNDLIFINIFTTTYKNYAVHNFGQ